MSLDHKEGFSENLKFVQAFKKWIENFWIDREVRVSAQRQKQAIATARCEGVGLLF